MDNELLTGLGALLVDGDLTDDALLRRLPSRFRFRSCLMPM